jgi:hypothetical protein
MTIGVIGTVLLYSAPLAVLSALVARGSWPVRRDGFLLLGGTIWLLIVLISSYSLLGLATVSGLATTAVGIGVLLYVLGSRAAPADAGVDPFP